MKTLLNTSLLFLLVIVFSGCDSSDKRLVIADTLNVRSSPNGPVIDKVSEGQRVGVFEQVGDWSRIGRNKWVASEYLSAQIINESSRSPEPQPDLNYRSSFACDLGAASCNLDTVRKFATEGNARAQDDLAEMYRRGNVSGMRNYSEAVRWWRLAAEQGYAEAQHDLAGQYASGSGVLENDAEAAKWYRLAAEQGHVRAQLMIAGMYRDGEGVSENDAEAARWYRLAAGPNEDLPGDRSWQQLAQERLGDMYRVGTGVRQNNLRAYMWYRLASQLPQKRMFHLSRIRDDLTPSQRLRAEDMATRCFESDYQDCE